MPLKDTGAAQGGDPVTTKIGPLPDLQRAINERVPQSLQLISPANGNTLFTLRPTLDWADYYNATKYEIQIATGSTFSPRDDRYNYHKYLLYSFFKPELSRTYWWRVRPMVDTAWRSWSVPSWSFTLAGASVPAPTLSSPADKDISARY